MRRNNALSHPQIIQLTNRLNELKEELHRTNPPAADLASRLTGEFGFRVTRHNLLNLVRTGVIEDFRKKAKPRVLDTEQHQVLRTRIAELEVVSQSQDKLIGTLFNQSHQLSSRCNWLESQIQLLAGKLLSAFPGPCPNPPKET